MEGPYEKQAREDHDKRGDHPYDDGPIRHGRWRDQQERDAENERRRLEMGERPSTAPDLGFPILLCVLIGIPVLIFWVIGTGVAKGGDWLAFDSPLAPLFPDPGDSVVQYAISSAALLILVSGGLFAAAALLGHRFTPLRRLVLVPLAVLSVPAILFATTSTTTIG